MIDVKKILWCINVYDKFAHLHIQEELLRRYFGQDLDIFVYCNNGDKVTSDRLHWKETMHYITSDNPGHHNGTIKSWNDLLTCGVDLNKYDYIVWTHADVIFSDYSLAMKAIEFLEDRKIVILQRYSTQHPLRPHLGIKHWISNGFFAMDVNTYKKVFPFYTECDKILFDGMQSEVSEIALGERVSYTLSEKDVFIVPCDFEWTRHNSFLNVFGTKNIICCENDFTKAMMLLIMTNPNLRDPINKCLK